MGFDANKYLEILKKLRYDYEEELPDKIVNSTVNSTTGLYKCQKGVWFQPAISYAWLIIEDGYASEKSKELFNNLLSYLEITTFKGDRLTNAEDIRLMNEVLDNLISDVENHPKRKKL